MATVPMVAPDGSVADVPRDSLQQALQAGAKPAADMIGPDGSRATVPLESVHTALQLGARPHPDSAALVAAASVPRPQVNMQGSALGQAVYGPASNDDSLRAAGYAGPAPSQINPYTSSAAMAAGPAALGATVAGKVGLNLWNLLGKIPKVGPFAQATALSEGIGYARRNLPGGKYIPSVAEIAPYFMGGGKGKVAAEAESEVAAAPKDAADPFRSVPDPEADVFREPARSPAP